MWPKLPQLTEIYFYPSPDFIISALKSSAELRPQLKQSVEKKKQDEKEEEEEEEEEKEEEEEEYRFNIKDIAIGNVRIGF